MIDRWKNTRAYLHVLAGLAVIAGILFFVWKGWVSAGLPSWVLAAAFFIGGLILSLGSDSIRQKRKEPEDDG